MGMRILPYRRGPELTELIRGLVLEGGEMRVIVPSRRDRMGWMERVGRRSASLIDDEPCVWTWQGLYDDVCAALGARRRRPISPPDHLLILERALERTIEEDPRLLELWPGAARAGALDILSDDVRELLDEAVSPEQLEAGLEAGAPHLLSKVYRRYLTYLEANGLLDSAQIWTATAELLTDAGAAWGRGLRLVFAGFLSFTHGQLELVKIVEGLCEDVTILKPEPGLAGFYDVAEQFAESTWQAVPEAGPGRIVEIVAAEEGLQPEVLARCLALWSAGEGPLAREMPFPGFDAVAIMTARGSEGPMSEALERYGAPSAIDRGIAIADSLPGRVLASVRRLRSLGFPTRETIALLSQPCFAALDFPADDALRAGPVGLAAWEGWLAGSEGEGARVALAALRSVSALCRALERGGTPSVLMEAFHAFLTTPGLWLDRMGSPAHPELDEAVRIVASAIETVGEKALTLRELLPDIGPIGKEELRGDDAFAFLDTWCRQSDTRPPLPLRGAVRLCVGPPPVLASWPVWIMMDVARRTWPGSDHPSPLLGAGERERLSLNGAHLPSPQDEAMQREALFRRLLQTGDALTIIVRASADDDGRPLAESPFVERFLEDMGTWGREILPPTSIDVLIGGDAPILGLDPGPTTSPARPMPVIHDPSRACPSLGVSDLDELLGCPLRWWLRRRARLRERALEPTTPMDWGVMAHALWEGVWRRVREDLGVDGAALSRLVREEIASLGAARGRYERFAWIVHDRRAQRRLEVFRERLLRLGDVQARVLDRMREAGLRHADVQLEEDARLTIEVDGVVFKGQCDRIEIVEDASGLSHAIITDYKSGRAGAHDVGMKGLADRPWNVDGRDAIGSGLQLSAYAAMWSRAREEAIAGACFLGLKDGKLAGTIEPELAPCFAPEAAHPKKLARPLRDREGEALWAMRCAAALLKEGSFAPTYDLDLCRACDAKPICRRGELKGEILSAREDDEDGGEER